MDPVSPAAATLGARILAGRKRAKFTQERLAEKASQDLLTIRRAEHGERDIRVSTLIAIADALGMNPADLVTGLTADMVPVREPRSENRKQLRAERTERARSVAAD